MTLRDLLLVLGAVPLLGVVAMRLAAEMGFADTAPPSDALTVTLGLFGFVFVVYVALTLRSIASATRDILARESETAQRETAAQRTAAVSDFAIHLDRSSEIDLRDGDAAGDEPAEQAAPPSGAPGPQRTQLFGEVNDLLTRIPSARSR
jgi:hypothetical protein